MNRKVRELQEDAEEDIGERHRAGLGKWKKAVSLARKFFASNRLKQYYWDERTEVADDIKSALKYPTFDFDRDGFEEFYKIQALGHLIEIRKPVVWRQRKRLRAALRQLVDDSKPIEARLSALVDSDGQYRIEGARLNFFSKVLAVHDPRRFTVFNQPIAKALESFGYETPRGYTVAQKYLEFASLMKEFLEESGARNTLDLDAFFYDRWERYIKPREKKK